MSPIQRPRLRWLLGVGALVACGLHLWYWYAPRARAGRPRGLAAAVLASPDLPVRLWLAYPHQNVGALADSVPDFDRWVGAVGRLAGTSLAQFPRFGPFRMPPARGLALASGPGGAFVAAAEVYPGIALLARLAGKLASNPWLSGGQVEVNGQTVTVGWSGWNGWWATSGAGAPPAAPAESTVSDVFALVRLREPIGVLPAGEIQLVRRPGGFEALDAGARGGDDVCAPVLPGGASSPERPILLLLAGPPSGAGGVKGGVSANGAGGLILWAGAAGRLPDLAVVNATGGRWRLPAEGLLGLAGTELPTGQVAGMEVRAYDRRTLERTLPLVSTLPASLHAGAFAVWIDPGPAGHEASRLYEFLRAVPLLSERDIREWGDLATVLAPLEENGPLSLSIAASPPCVRLRLSPSQPPS